MTDEKLYRNRFLILTLARFGGLVVFMLGVAIVYTDLVRPGGWPALGAMLAIAGAIDVLLAPRLLKRAWDRKDR